ncbi:MAG: hypothetical protein EOP50_00490 [Sphingobacteriales bacterium]|nr:MAG: hypothetical protein EOP50_00490 [Sphingobacteriales bacterium]
MNGALFISYLDILKLYSRQITSASGAHYRYKRIKKALEKEQHQSLTVNDLARYEGVPVEHIVQALLAQK